MHIKTFFAALAASALCACQPAQPAATPHVEDAWARSTAPGQSMAAIYMTVTNEGETPVRLVAVSSDVAGKASMHQTLVENGIARMHPIDKGLAIEPGDYATFQPNGDHVMLEGLKRQLTPGETITLTLRFADGASVEAPVAIVEAGSR